MLNIYLFVALLVIVFGLFIPVEGEPNIVNVVRSIWRGEDGWQPWGELASIAVIAVLWPVALVVLIVLGVVLRGLLKDG